MSCAKARSQSKVPSAVLGDSLPLPPSRPGLRAHRSHHPRLREDHVLGEDVSGLASVLAQAEWLPL